MVLDRPPGLGLVQEHRVDCGGCAGGQAGALLPQEKVSALLRPLAALPVPGDLLQLPARPDRSELLAAGLVQAPPHLLPVAGLVGGGAVAQARD